MTGVGIAGLDANLRVDQFGAALGIVTEGRGVPMQGLRAGLGAGDVDRGHKAEAVTSTVGAGDDDGRDNASGRATWGIDNSHTARFGVAGNLHTSLMSNLPRMLRPGRTERERLGDVAAEVGWQYGVYFSDYTYVICTADHGRGEEMRWRKGRKAVFGREHRILPLFFDSGAYRRHTGTAPNWASQFETYLKAIDLAQPDGFASYDFFDDKERSLRYFDKMCRLGYGPARGCFPVYHVQPAWDDGATVTGVDWRNVPEGGRCAIANARIAARDPVLRHYAKRARIIGLGGMVRGPVPRDFRHWYIAELCRLFPDHQWWGLGQANYKVVNGLGRLGLLDRVWLDGSWWILDAAAERFAVVEDGLIRMHSIEGVARSFFTITECMAANLRSLLSAYAGLWDWPPPDPIPLDLHDRDEAEELHRRMHQASLELFGDNGEVRVYGDVPVRVT
jgi:hypothetical protein